MTGGRAALTGSGLGVVGLALLFFESARGLTGSSFNTLALILLYGGLGLIVIAGAVLVGSIPARPARATTGAPEDAALDG